MPGASARQDGRRLLSLDSAIALLAAETSQLSGRKLQEGSTLWWTLRAKSTGLSLLRAIKTKGLSDPSAAEEFRKSFRTSLMIDPAAPDDSA